MVKVKADSCAQFSVLAFVVCAGCLVFFTSKYLNVYKEFLKMEAGTCTTVNSFIDEDALTRCGCGKDCQRTYPCLVVEVTLNRTGPPEEELVTVAPSVVTYDSNHSAEISGTQLVERVRRKNRGLTKGTMMMFENEAALYGKDCSYIPRCSASYKVLEKRVGNYNGTYGVPGTVFRCSFSSKHEGTVIRVTAKKTKFIHFFLWPSLGVLSGIIGLIYSVKMNPRIKFLSLIGVTQTCSCIPGCKTQEAPEDNSPVRNQNNQATTEEMEKMKIQA